MKMIRVIISILLCASCSVMASEKPVYLENRSDFVQQVFSTVLVGFAFETKCNYLSIDDRAEYEERLIFSTEIFQGYILAKEIVLSPDEALNYLKSMALGVKKYSSSSACDAVANKRVLEGFEVGKNYMSIIESELTKEVR